MDALALLCTLHADGPATLQRLRGAGLGSLEALGGVGAERLGETLGLPAAAARRLLREARHLAQRLEADLLDRDEGAPSLAALAGRRPVQARNPGWQRGESGPATGEAEAGAETRGAAGQRRGGERALVARVLETWRELEDSPVEARPDAPGDGAPAVGAHPRSAARPRELGAAHSPGIDPSGQVDASGPIGAPRRAGLALVELDRGVAAELTAQGIGDSNELLGRDLVQLSRASGIAYTRLARIAFLARRAGVGEAAAARASVARFSPAEFPAAALGPRTTASGGSEGVGGPFA